MNQYMHYRKDIQILRGIAVILVVLFHLEIGGIQSGFLGVDIFFVISGFLMAVLYTPDDKGKFFRRRAKRLLPTYYIIILFTLIMSIFITIPNEFNQIIEQSTYASFFSSNIGFWIQNSYFDKSAFKPLLHLWSLGVEIQFYLIVPILYWFFHKSKIMFPIVFIVSLLLCFVIVGISPKTSFFMMPLRLWEFLIGYGIAIYYTNNGNIKNTSFGWIGLIALIFLIVIPSFSNIETKSVGFLISHPGLYALLVSLATGVILMVGMPTAIVKSKLGTSFEILGKYSYSIYLVHFPVIVLFLYEPFSGTILKANNFVQTVTLIFIIGILSILSYHFIENPARHSKKFIRYLLILIFLIVVFVFFGKQIKSLTYSTYENNIFHAWDDRSTYRCGKMTRILNPTAISCNLTEDIKKPNQKIFLVGNSHADSIKTTFVSVAKKFNVSVYFILSNDPLMSGSRIQAKDIIKEAKKNKIDAIVLHYSPKGINIDNIKELVKLAKETNIKISFIMPVPIWEKHIPQILFNHLDKNESLPIQTQDDYQKVNETLYKDLKKIEDLPIYSVDNILCQPYCKFQDERGRPYYFDKGHLTLTGSETLYEVFEAVIIGILK